MIIQNSTVIIHHILATHEKQLGISNLIYYQELSTAYFMISILELMFKTLGIRDEFYRGYFCIVLSAALRS